MIRPWRACYIEFFTILEKIVWEKISSYLFGLNREYPPSSVKSKQKRSFLEFCRIFSETGFMSSRRITSIGARKEWIKSGNMDLNQVYILQHSENYLNSKIKADSSLKRYNSENLLWKGYTPRNIYPPLNVQFLPTSSLHRIMGKWRGLLLISRKQLPVFLVLSLDCHPRKRTQIISLRSLHWEMNGKNWLTW